MSGKTPKPHLISELFKETDLDIYVQIKSFQLCMGSTADSFHYHHSIVLT